MLRPGGCGEPEYLCEVAGPDRLELLYDKRPSGCWWRLTAVGHSRFVAESLKHPGRCLAAGPFGLHVGPAVTERERNRQVRGLAHPDSTLTVLALPDYVARGQGVIVN